ncbi:acyl-CoA dehydrogenase family protein [Rhodoferax sp.]|uniref:acyl-CoA dehydrogenase family protein n=1 Tax=Rhodoferax sp. TaxID=50421 RepID=UPI002609AB4B|nr:acyl-CoA dehydrogenase family protein [Rhodoferax sp.]MDD3937607.1 acyl-CoA dehydrogenase family protein [Rhodoferax sp.]
MTIYSEEHEQLRRQVRRFVETEIIPNGEKWEREGNVPREFIKRMGDLGFLGIGFPETYGGSGMDFIGWMVLAEELGRSTYAGVVGVATVHTLMAAPHLMHAGNAEQLERYMPGIISGELLTAVAISEADAGSDVGAMRTKAIRTEGGWLLNGTKYWISNGVNADLYFVAARTDPAGKGAKGISMFIVEKNTPGFKVSRKLDKLGFRSSDTAELIFEDCFVPNSNLLGDEHRGFYAVMENFQTERLILCTLNIAECMTALGFTIQYVRDRKAFGVALVKHQVLRQKISMLLARAEAGRRMVQHAAILLAKGEKAILEVSMAKAYCGELVNETMYTCLQYHGGAGFLKGTAIERMFRDARLYSIGGGATEVMLEEVAKRWDEIAF